MLVGHSLGGLVARQVALDTVIRSGGTSALNKPRIHLALYAVPNLGTNLAKLASTLAWWNIQIKQLCRNSDFVSALNKNWDYYGLDKLRIVYVLGTNDSIVDQDSARHFPGNGNVEVVMDATHSNIISPVDNEDIRYLILKDFLSDLEAGHH